MNMRISCLTLLVMALLVNSSIAHQHTHIGRNPDGIWGTGDDNKLWIFAKPTAPDWGVIELVPTGEEIAEKLVYTAELDCWHSAHPASNLYQLDFNSFDDGMPDWQLALNVVSFSSMDFWMQDQATGQVVLENAGDIFHFPEPHWNEARQAWRLHHHLEFFALADGPGEIFIAVFTAQDHGATGFIESDPYTMTFVTVPEPTTVMLLAIAAPLLRRRTR